MKIILLNRVFCKYQDLIKKSFKQVHAVLQPEIFSLPMLSHLGKEIQFRIVKKYDHLKKSDSNLDVNHKITQILLNLHKLVIFLAPILPKNQETQNLINIDLSSNGSGDDETDHHQNDDDHNKNDGDHQNHIDDDHLDVEHNGPADDDRQAPQQGDDHHVVDHHRYRDEDQHQQPRPTVRFSNVDDHDVPQISDMQRQQIQISRKKKEDISGFSLPEEKPLEFQPSRSVPDISLNRPKLPKDTPPRPHKYSLRRNRQIRKFDDFVEI